jgi:hypothetical protein
MLTDPGVTLLGLLLLETLSILEQSVNQSLSGATQVRGGLLRESLIKPAPSQRALQLDHLIQKALVALVTWLLVKRCRGRLIDCPRWLCTFVVKVGEPALRGSVTLHK